MNSYLDTIAGLPTHALVVHAAVVLVPLAAIGGILMAFLPWFSRRFGPLVVILAGISALACIVAKQSGEVFAVRVGLPQEHADYGAVMPLVAGILFAALAGLWLVDRGIPLNRSRTAWATVLAVVSVVVAVFALYWTLRTGHTGATAVWSSIVEATTPGNN